MFDFKSVNDVFALVAGRGDRPAMQGQDATGEWKTITSNDLYGRVRALAEMFQGWGVGRGDRVAHAEREPVGVDR